MQCTCCTESESLSFFSVSTFLEIFLRNNLDPHHLYTPDEVSKPPNETHL